MSIQVSPTAAAATKASTPANSSQSASKAPSAASLSHRLPPTEIPSKRTAYSNTYDNHDGTYTAQVSSGPINYLDPVQKTYQHIDTTLAPISGKNGRVRASHMTTPVEVGAADDPSGFVSVDTGKGIIRMFLASGVQPGKPGEKPATKGPRADLAGLMANTDLQAVVGATGVRTFFVLNSLPTRSSFSISLDAGALTPVLQSDGSIQFLDKKGDLAASMPVPYAVDSNIDPHVGSGKMTTAVSYSLAPNAKQWLLTVTVDPVWLASATYPVYVDPSVIGTSQVTNNTVNNQSAYANSSFTDMYLTTGYYEFLVGYDGSSQWATYMKFNLAAAGINEYPLSATLDMYPWHQWYGTSSGERTYVKEVGVSWGTNVTWNNAPFHATPYPTADASFVGVQGQWTNQANWTNGNLLTSWAQDWVLDSSTNFGIYLYGAQSDYHYWKRFTSSGSSSNKPYLDITYAVPSDTASTPAGNNATNSLALAWSYNPNGSPSQTKSQVQVSTNSGFTGTPVYDSNQVANTAASWPVPSNTLTAGTTYYWRVKSFNGYGWSDWSAGAQFRFDNVAPNTPTFTAPTAQVDIQTTSYTASWIDSDVGLGIASYAYTWLRTPVASANVCGTSWTSVSTGTTGAGNSGSASISSMTTAYCYKVQLTATDSANNVSPTATSSPILVDTSSPSLTVTDNCGTIGACYRIGNTIYFQPSAAKTITLTASVSPMPPSGICYTWGPLSSTTGWSGYVPGTTCATTSSRTLTWSSSAVQTSLTVTATTGAGKSSSVPIQFTPDIGAQVGWSAPVSGHTNPVPPGSFSVAWTETAGLTPITARSLQRMKVAANPDGSCPTTGWGPEGNPSQSGSPVAQTLSTGTCYEWVETLTDSLGAHAFTSAPVSVDTGPIATISSPIAGQALSGNITISGTASDDYLASCTLQYGPGANPSPSSLHTITSNCPLVSNGTLVVWAPNGLTGAYTIILTVTNGAGATAPSSVLVYLDNTDRGPETHFASVPFDLDGGWKLGVNVATGEASLARDFFSIPSFGPSQALSLAYNSNEPSAAGKFGIGWSSNLTQYLSFESGFIVWHRADGSLVPFGLVTGTTWTPITGHHEQLSSASGTCGQASSTCLVKLADQTSLSFEGSGAGRLLAITDRFGKSLSLSWNSNGLSATATDASTPTGRTTSLAIDSANARISTVTDSAGRSWSFGYTGTGSASTLTSITDDALNVTTLGYDAATHRLVSVERLRTPVGQSPVALDWSIGYAADLAHVNSVADPIGGAQLPVQSTVFAYVAGQTTVTQPRDPSGTSATPTSAVSVYAYDSHGWVTTTTDAIGYDTQTKYYDDGNPQWSKRDVDHSGTVAETDYEWVAGNLTKETDPLGIVTDYTYNPATNDIWTKTVSGTTPSPALSQGTRYLYDDPGPTGHLCREIENPVAADVAGLAHPCTDSLQATQSDPDKNVDTRYDYYPTNQLKTKTDPLGIVTLYTYDQWGNELSETHDYVLGVTPDAHTNVATSYYYHLEDPGANDEATKAGRKGLYVTQTNPVGVVTSYTYDVEGNITSTTTPGVSDSSGDAGSPAQMSSTAYDEFGAADKVTVQVCQSNGPACASWLPADAGTLDTTTTTFDALGHATSVTDATSTATTTTSTTFDLGGDAIETVAADGTTTKNDYYALGQLWRDTPPSTVQTTHTYDGLGDELSASADAPGESTSSTYDPDGNVRIETEDPAGADSQTTHTYDALGREKVVTDPAGQVTTTTYDAVGRVKRTVAGTAITDTTYDRDGHALTTTSPYQTGQTPVMNATAYDALGRACRSVQNATIDLGTLAYPCTDLITSTGTTNIATTTYFDAAGHAVATVDAKGIVTRTFFDPSGHAATTIANCTDSGTTPSADPPNCQGVIPAPNSTTDVVTTSTYSVSGVKLSSTTLAGTLRTTQTFDGAGRVLTSTIDPGDAPHLKLETYYAYDSHGRQIATKSPTGVITITIYDGPSGRVSKTVTNCTFTDPGTSPVDNWATCDGTTGAHDGTWNQSTSYAYDAAGNKHTETAPNNTVTGYLYDPQGHMISRTDNYQNDGIPANQPGNINVTTYYYYDSAGRRVATEAPTPGGSYGITLDDYYASGYLKDEVLNCTSGGTTPTPADLANPPSCTGGGTADGSTNITTSYSYDAAGNRVEMDAPSPANDASGTTTVKTLYAYDANNHLCRVIENADVSNPTCDSSITSTATTNVVMAYAYDANGNLSDQTAPAPEGHTGYVYDSLGHLRSQTDALGHETTWTYDANGNKTSETDPDGQTIFWSYDAAGRLCRRTAFDSGSSPTWPADRCADVRLEGDVPAVDTHYERDNAGNLTVAKDELTLTIITSTYDGLSRPWTVSGDASADPSTVYTYGVGAVTRTDASGSYAFTMDHYGRQSGLVDPLHPSNPYAWTYALSGQVATTTDPTGNVTTNTYDPVGRLTARSTTGSSGCTGCASLTDTYNDASNIVSSTSTITTSNANGTTDYAYDALDRLTNFTPIAPLDIQPQVYTSNGSPDRATIKIGTGNRLTMTYEGASRLASDSAGGTYTYDHEGRLTAMPGESLTYDALGRLVTVSGTNNATYTYDALDRLRTVTEAGVTTRLRYVGLTNAVAQEIDGSNSVLKNHATDAGGTDLFDFNSVGAILGYLGRNSHNDVVWTASSTGAVATTLTYDPYGNLAASTGSSLPNTRWQSSWQDPTTHFYYVVARWYSPTLGTFISTDPMSGDALQPETRNSYAYGGGDAVDNTDASGQCYVDDDVMSMGCTGQQLSQAQARYELRQARLRAYQAQQAIYKRRGLEKYNRIATYMAGQMQADIAVRLPHWIDFGWKISHEGISIPFDINPFDTSGMNDLYLVDAFYVYFHPYSTCRTDRNIPQTSTLLNMCGKWDYKNQLSQYWSRNASYSEKMTPVAHDRRDESVSYDIWANILYGYVGKSFGVPENILATAATNPKAGVTDQSDKDSVALGFNLWNRYGTGITVQELKSAVLGEMPKWARNRDNHVVQYYVAA
jgi:RHS repeat-associated protein